MVGRAGEGIGRRTHLVNNFRQLGEAVVGILLDLVKGALHIARDALGQPAFSQAGEHARHVFHHGRQLFAGAIGIPFEFAKGALVVARNTLRQITLCEATHDAPDIGERNRGGFHQRIHTGAKRFDRATQTLQSNALTQVARLRCRGDAVGLLHRGPEHVGGSDVGRHVRGNLDDLGDPPHFVGHRRINGLQEYLLTRFGEAFKDRALRLALVQIGPELLVSRCVGDLDRTEHAVVLALDLGQLVAHGLQEVGVGLQHMAAQIKLDVGVGGVDGVQNATRILAFDLGFGDVIAHAQVLHGLAVVTQNRRHHGVHIVGRAVLGAVFDDAAKDLATANGGPHFLEHGLGHIGVARGVVAKAY